MTRILTGPRHGDESLLILVFLSAYQPPASHFLIYSFTSSSTDTGFLQREAESVAPKAILRQLRRSPTPPLTSPELEPEESQGNHERQRRPSLTSLASSSSSIKSFGSSLVQHKRDPNWKEPEPYEGKLILRTSQIRSQIYIPKVLRAVERKDIMYLMEVRDSPS